VKIKPGQSHDLTLDETENLIYLCLKKINTKILTVLNAKHFIFLSPSNNIIMLFSI